MSVNSETEPILFDETFSPERDDLTPEEAFNHELLSKSKNAYDNFSARYSNFDEDKQNDRHTDMYIDKSTRHLFYQEEQDGKFIDLMESGDQAKIAEWSNRISEILQSGARDITNDFLDQSSVESEKDYELQNKVFGGFQYVKKIEGDKIYLDFKTGQKIIRAENLIDDSSEEVPFRSQAKSGLKLSETGNDKSKDSDDEEEGNLSAWQTFWNNLLKPPEQGKEETQQITTILDLFKPSERGKPAGVKKAELSPTFGNNREIKFADKAPLPIIKIAKGKNGLTEEKNPGIKVAGPEAIPFPTAGDAEVERISGELGRGLTSSIHDTELRIFEDVNLISLARDRGQSSKEVSTIALDMAAEEGGLSGSFTQEQLAIRLSDDLGNEGQNSLGAQEVITSSSQKEQQLVNLELGFVEIEDKAVATNGNQERLSSSQIRVKTAGRQGAKVSTNEGNPRSEEKGTQGAGSGESVIRIAEEQEVVATVSSIYKENEPRIDAAANADEAEITQEAVPENLAQKQTLNEGNPRSDTAEVWAALDFDQIKMAEGEVVNLKVEDKTAAGVKVEAEAIKITASEVKAEESTSEPAQELQEPDVESEQTDDNTEDAVITVRDSKIARTEPGNIEQAKIVQLRAEREKSAPKTKEAAKPAEVAKPILRLSRERTVLRTIRERSFDRQRAADEQAVEQAKPETVVSILRGLKREVIRQQPLAAAENRLTKVADIEAYRKTSAVSLAKPDKSASKKLTKLSYRRELLAKRVAQTATNSQNQDNELELISTNTGIRLAA